MALGESNTWSPLLNAFYHYSRGMAALSDFVLLLNVSATCNFATIIAPVSRGWMEAISVPAAESEDSALTKSGTSSSSVSFTAMGDVFERTSPVTTRSASCSGSCVKGGEVHMSFCFQRREALFLLILPCCLVMSPLQNACDQLRGHEYDFSFLFE